jgi:dihydrofolate synthase / folylpolyglutamate synthase
VLNRELAVGGQQLDLRGLRGDYHEIYLPLFGGYQAGNAACALAAVEAFSGTSDDDLPGARPEPLEEGWIRNGFASVTSPGRMEVVRRSPVTIVDAAHNPAGMAATMEAVAEAFRFARLVCVLAVNEDKDVPGILDQIEPFADDLVVTANSSPRSMDVVKLAALAESIFGPERLHAAARLDEAIDIAVTLADEISAGGSDTDLFVPGASGVLITGSVITAGDAKRLLAPARQAGQDGTPEAATAPAGNPDRQPQPQEPGEPAEPDPS